MQGLSLKHVVVPLDFGELSLETLDRATEIRGNEAPIDVVHVLPI